MPDLHGLERFLQASLSDSRQAESPSVGPRVRPFVTISREFGAGGHTLAVTMRDVFARQDDPELFGGWQVFDQKLCEIAAEDPRLAASVDALAAEEYRTRADEFVSQLLKPAPDQDYVMGQVFRVVRTLAGAGKAIIIGRAGSEVTRGMRAGVSLRLVAPEEARIARVVAQRGMSEREARELARRKDDARARLLKRHFHVDISDPLGYDAVWNTGRVTFEAIAEAVVALLRQRMAALPGETGAG